MTVEERPVSSAAALIIDVRRRMGRARRFFSTFNAALGRCGFPEREGASTRLAFDLSFVDVSRKPAEELEQ
jgi:hypothetical protein